MDFEFNNEKLSDYGMIICAFDGSLDGTFSSGADITFQQTSNILGRNLNIYGAYSTPYQATFSICKDIYNIGDNDEGLSPILVSSLQRWLCLKNSYKEFRLIGDDNYNGLYWNSTFTSQQILYGGKIVGLTLTMYTDSPYAYRDRITNTFENVRYFEFADVSDEIGYIQPDLQIQFKANGNFTLTNSLDNRVTSIKNCNQSETITINGTKEIISTDSSTHELTLARDFNYFFPKIINTYDNRVNSFTLNLACNITITYSPIIKVGM